MNLLLQRKTTIRQFLFSLLIVFLGSSGSAFSEELVMSGRLILQDGNQGWQENTPAPNSKIKSGFTIGVAFFDDDTIAEKQYIFAQSNGDLDGSLSGFSLYTFDNGDSLLMEFEASWTEDGLIGQYLRVLEGTGRFTGATGGGTLKGVAGPWYETIMTDVRLNLVLVD